MANSVTFPINYGGSGITITDDTDPETGLDGTGYIERFVPALKQSVVMVGHAVQKASEASQSAVTASGAAEQATNDREQVALDRAETIRQRQLAATAAGDAQSAKMSTLNASAETYAVRDAVSLTATDVASDRDKTLAAAASAQEAEQEAGDHRAQAETARDAALANGAIYADVAAGLTATVDGNFFTTPVAGGTDFLMLYRNDNGTATPLNAYPSQRMLVYGVEFSTANRLITMFMQLEIRMDRLPAFDAPPAI